MKRYREYKESGVEWLGEIPGHWDMVKLKYIAPLINEDPSAESSGFSVALENIEGGTGRYIKTDSSFTSRGNGFRSGDILLNKLRPYLSKVYLAQRAGASIGELLVLRPALDVESSFLFYRLVSREVISAIDGSTYGAKMPRASWDFIGELRIPMPPPAEQRTIAAFLDRKTQQIDTLIEKKRRLIELLKEQRTALINRAVTKGLDPNVQMKDSGIEWLGEVPEHWTITKLKWISSKIGSGITPRGGAAVYQASGIPLLRSQNIREGKVFLDDVAFISEEIHESMSRTALQFGDVLLNITGASIGRSAVVPKGLTPANVNQHVCIVRPTERVLPHFAYLVLSSFVGQNQIFSYQDGSSREGLNFEQLGNFAIPLPHRREQELIVAQVRKRIQESEKVLHKTELIVRRLSELRTSLISEVVTGKIDVRDWDRKADEALEVVEAEA